MNNLMMIAYVRARRRRLIANNRRRLRMLRDSSDPFNTTDQVFMTKYRLTKELARTVIEVLRPYLREPERSNGIPVEIKVLGAFHIYAHGSGQFSAASDSYLGLSQPSMSRCMTEVTNALNTPAVLTRFIRFPVTREERAALIHRNYVKHKIPGVLGFVDGTHVAIKTPRHREDLYVNRKSFHSMNVQMFCDTDLRILNVLARFPGGAHDSHIWGSSQLRAEMVQIFRDGEQCWILGDSGYPEEPWLLCPILNAEAGTREARYTYMHKKARSTVERCIGVLKQRFRCLTRAHESQYGPQTTCAITKACCILHNMCIDARVPLPVLTDDDRRMLLEEAVPHVPAEAPRPNGQRGQETLLEQSRRVRGALIQRLFR